MNIIFKKVSIFNFLSFGSAEVALDDRGFVLVNGINEHIEDNAKSNGSGKSALWDSIIWALTGDTIRGTSKEIVNINATGGCKVQLEFEVDSHNYIVIRSKDHSELGTTLKLYVDDKDVSGKGIRDTEKILQSYLPELDSSFIGAVIILGQGMPQRFSNNTPSGRKEILEKLSKSDFMIEDIKQRLSTRKTSISNSLREIQDKLVELNTKQTMLTSQESSLNTKLDSLYSEKPSSDKIDSLQTQLDSLNNEYDTVKKDYDSKKDELESISSSLNKLNDYIFEKRSEIEGKYACSIESAESRSRSASWEYEKCKKALSEIENIKDVCPTCGQKLPEVHKPDKSPYIDAVNSAAKEVEDAKSDLCKIRKDKTDELDSITKEFNSQKAKIESERDSVKHSISRLNEKLSSVQSNRNECEREISKIKSNIESYDARVKETLSSIELTKSEIEKVNTDILYNKSMEESTKTHSDVVNKMLTLATRDFRGYLLSNVIDFINARAKSYSKDIFGTDSIEFSLEGNNINISYENKLYENLSGGERQRIDIIVQFSLRDMLKQFSAFNCNLLVLDELLDSLDKVSSDAVIDFLTKRLVDVSSIFFITHHSDLQIPSDSSIIVYKDARGVSSVR